MERLFKFVIFILCVSFDAVVSGTVLSILWKWFMVPLGMPVVGWALACGITVVANYLTRASHNPPNPETSITEDALYGAWMTIIHTITYLGIGAILHFFM